MAEAYNSLHEVSKVIDTLTSLCHYPHDFKEFPQEHLRLIQENFRTATCSEHLHPGLTCFSYLGAKFFRQFKTGLKLSLMFIVLPAVVSNFRKLLKDNELRKRTLIKYIRSTIYLTVGGALPASLMCIFMKFGMKMGKLLAVSTFGMGFLIAYLFETPDRHVQLLSFMLPKALETLYTVLELRKYYKSRDWHTYAISVLTWSIIALFALRENQKQRKKVQEILLQR